MEPFTAFVLLMIAATLATAFSSRPNMNANPQSFDASSLPVADEGTRIIEVFGDVNVGTWMVLGYGNYRTKKIKTKSSKK